MSNRPSSTSAAATRLTVWPSSSAIELRGIGVDHVGDLVHRALLHQQSDHVDRAFGHAVGEFLDGDGFRDDHLADQLLLRLVRGVPLQALGAAAERGDRALAHVIGSERGDHGEAPALLLRRRLVVVFGAATGRMTPPGPRRTRRGPSSSSASAATLGARVAGATAAGRRRRRCRGGRGAGGLSLAETLLGFEFGLALGLFVVAMALFLGLAAGFGGFAFGLFDAFAAGTPLGFLFRHPPFFRLANAGIGERADARGVLVLGQACAAPHRRRCAARRAEGWQPGGRRAAPWRPVRPWRLPVPARAGLQRPAYRHRHGACRAFRPPPAWSGRGGSSGARCPSRRAA